MDLEGIRHKGPFSRTGTTGENDNFSEWLLTGLNTFTTDVTSNLLVRLKL